MANAHSHDSHDASHGSVKTYAIGFILSVILTLIPFGLVMYPTLPKSITLMIVLAFAVIQVLVHWCTSCTWTAPRPSART